MTHLYSCRHSGDEYRITKFDSDMEVISSYLCTTTECDCPAGSRPSCRHRQMLPSFISRDMIDKPWLYDFDRGGWVQSEIEYPESAHLPESAHAEEPALDAAPAVPVVEGTNVTATEITERMQALQGPRNPVAEHLVNTTYDILDRAGLINKPAQPPLGVGITTMGSGITMIEMDKASPMDLFNVIAEAVGEPLHKPAPTLRRRGF
jgi:hypothetical protein